MNRNRKTQFAIIAIAILVGLTGSTLSAQKDDSKGQSYLAKARAFSKMTGRPIFVVAGSKT